MYVLKKQEEKYFAGEGNGKNENRGYKRDYKTEVIYFSLWTLLPVEASEPKTRSLS